ncbi:MAG: hypothetical protein BWX70_03184 [Verrucomicrobia bacterium ADurb.Bin070]|nr:MAG: hypothetical protein BWX70_03184 [Verrucomicrobia bacterium ADurb.Bin070]
MVLARVIGRVDGAAERGLGHEMPGFRHVAAPDLACGDDGAERDHAGAHQAALAAEEDRGPVQQHALRHVADEGRRGLVLMRREVEVDVRRADLRMVLAARAAGHQRIAEVDQAAGRDPRQEDRLLDTHAMRDRRALLEQAARAHVRPAAGLEAVQKGRALKKAASQLDAGAELAVVHGGRRLAADHARRTDGEIRAAQAAAGMDDRARRDAVGVDVGRDVGGFGGHECDAAGLKLVKGRCLHFLTFNVQRSTFNAQLSTLK